MLVVNSDVDIPDLEGQCNSDWVIECSVILLHTLSWFGVELVVVKVDSLEEYGTNLAFGG